MKPETTWPKEIPFSREYFGEDETAINKHSIRKYSYKGETYYLNRNLSGCPPFYTLYYFKPKICFASKIFVEEKEYWGDGLPWPKAIHLAFEAIKKFSEEGG